jgi:hypothetical protein
VSILLLWVALLSAAQTPAQRGARAPAAAARRDTIYVAVQSPSPTINVEAPSQAPAVILGILGLVLVGFQVWIMLRQTTIMSKQTVLGEQQAAWKRDEAIGTFYRMAFDLAEEFRKANVSSFDLILANYDAHPRQVLRQASAVFAPLGNTFVMAANQAGMRLDEYFLAVERYNKPFRQEVKRQGDASLENQSEYNTVQSFRGIVGGDLDLANGQIPAELRWKYSNGRDYTFRAMCSLPAPMRDTHE